MQRLKRQMKQHWQLYLIFLIPLIQVLIFKYGPMYGLVIAFKRYNPVRGIIDSPWVGLKYFEQFFASPSSWSIIFNTLRISITTLIFSFPFPIMLAIALHECGHRFYKKAVQMITYAPYFISTVVLVGIILQVTDLRMGVINIAIKMLGGQPINFMGKPDMFTSIYVISDIWAGAGYSSILYLAALSGVSPELHEAAIMDGASRVRRVWHIDFPTILPTVVLMLIMNMGKVMNLGYEKVYLMQNDLNISVSEVISTYVYKVGLKQSNYSFSTAIGLMNTVVSLVLVSMSNYTAKKLTGNSMW